MCKKIDQIQDEIIKNFSRFDDWFEMYEYLIDLGKSNIISDQVLRIDENSVSGCQSQVWIKAEYIGEKIHYIADSDSLITKGIISLILMVLDNQPINDILNADLYFINEIGLGSNLSPSRVNGLNSFINQIRLFAKNSKD
jgi:cysteine desulfuration protein SufE